MDGASLAQREWSSVSGHGGERCWCQCCLVVAAAAAAAAVAAVAVVAVAAAVVVVQTLS